MLAVETAFTAIVLGIGVVGLFADHRDLAVWAIVVSAFLGGLWQGARTVELWRDRSLTDSWPNV